MGLPFTYYITLSQLLPALPWGASTLCGTVARMKVVLAVALSADGYVSPSSDIRSYEWTSKEDRRHFVQLSKQMQVIIMGAKTFQTFKIKRAPPGRRLIVYTHDPGTIAGENIQTTAMPPQDLVQQLAAEGIETVILYGGMTIYSMFLAAGVVDEVYLTIEPILFGAGVPFLQTPLGIRMQLLEQSNLNANTILLHYAIER